MVKALAEKFPNGYRKITVQHCNTKLRKITVILQYSIGNFAASASTDFFFCYNFFYSTVNGRWAKNCYLSID